MNTPILCNRLRGALAALAVPLALAACNQMLDVNNPSIIQGDQLDDPSMARVMADGIESQFQRTFNTQDIHMSIISDELMDGHVYLPEHEWDSRDLFPTEEYVTNQFATVHALRGAADSLGAKIESAVGDSASSSLSLARARVFGGWAYLMLGENFCQSPIDGGPALTDEQLLTEAIAHFDKAIASAGASQDPNAARYLYLARVGVARAALDLNDKTKAASYAEDVPADFVFWAEYSDNSTGQENDFYNPLQTYADSISGVRWIALDPPYQNLHDLRIPQTDSMKSLMDTRAGYIPYQPSSFNGWKPDGSHVGFTKGDFIRVASGLEARYIIQEVQGPTLAFLNERRAVGGQPALTALPADPMAELRDQRRRDLFMDTHRWADMRRYKAQYGIDLFNTPDFTGAYPGIANMEYHDNECIPISQTEIDNNKNLH